MKLLFSSLLRSVCGGLLTDFMLSYLCQLGLGWFYIGRDFSSTPPPPVLLARYKKDTLNHTLDDIICPRDRLSHQSAAGHRHVGRSVTMYYCCCMSRLWVEVRLSISDAIEKYKHLLVLEVATVSWMAVQITVDAMSPGRPTARGEMRIGGDLHRISILI